MKKKVAESEANFKILPPAYNFNSNITNNTGVFSGQPYSITDTAQLSSLKSPCSPTASSTLTA